MSLVSLTCCYISNCLCNILITIKVHMLVKTNRYMKMHGETIKKTLHVSDSSSVHHQEFFTVHTAMVYVIQVCWQFASSQAVSKPVRHIPLLCVQWKTPDDGQGNCPKHVEFYSKNKFEKLVHMVGFIISKNGYVCLNAKDGNSVRNSQNLFSRSINTKCNKLSLSRL